MQLAPNWLSVLMGSTGLEWVPRNPGMQKDAVLVSWPEISRFSNTGTSLPYLAILTGKRLILHKHSTLLGVGGVGGVGRLGASVVNERVRFCQVLQGPNVR